MNCLANTKKGAREMSANELADELEKLYRFKCHDAATMLRQQQAEIEELKLQVGVWEKEAMNARIKFSLYQAEIKELRKAQEK